MVQFKGRVEPGRAPAGEGRKPVGCAPLSISVRLCNRPYLRAPGKRGLPPTFPWNLFSRPAPHAAGRELGLFSGSIPPWFVPSNDLSITNTRAIWLCFGAFLSPPAPCLLLHGALTTGHYSPATRHSPLPPRHPPGPAGSGPAQTLPRWLLPDTDSRFAKDRTGPDLDERPLYIHYVTEPGNSCGKIKPFFPTRHHPTVDHSLVAGGAQRQWLQARLPDGHTAQCLFSTCSP